MAHNKGVGAFRPHFTLDMRKASSKGFTTLIEQYDEWRKEQGAPSIHLEDGWHTITPEMAEQLLLLNPAGANRKASLATIVYYADQMIAGDWPATGQPIIFSVRKMLMDGQHRLWACYLSGTSFTTYVVNQTVEIPGVFAYIDNAKSRSTKDALYTAGYDGLSSSIDQVAKMSWMYENNGYTASEKRQIAKLSPKRLVDYVGANPNLVEGTRLVAGEYAAAKTILREKDVAGFTAAKLLDLYDESVLDDFFTELNTDTSDAPDGDPIAALHHVLAGEAKKTTDWLKKHQMLGHVILVFNAWIEKKPIKGKLKLAVADPFPKFLELKDDRMAA